MGTNDARKHDGIGIRPDGEAEAVAGTGWQDYNARILHGSHGEAQPRLGQANESWLATRDEDLDSVVSVARIRDENSDVYGALLRSIGEDDMVRILRTIIARHGGVTYDDLDDYVGGVAKRTIKAKVSTLRDRGVLDVGNGRPAAIGFPDRDVALLVEDALAFLE